MSMSLVDTAVPVLGVFVTCLLFSSSVPGSLRARKTGVLEQDPTPSLMTLINVMLWIVYASMIGDLWIFAGSFFGALCNSFNSAIAMRCAEPHVRTRMTWMLVAGNGAVTCCVMFLASPTVIKDEDTRKEIMSRICIAICLLMFASPLVQGGQALVSGDASKINTMLSCAQLSNGVLWSAYGLGQGDVTVYLPNGTAVVLAVMNLIVKVVVSARAAALGRDQVMVEEVVLADAPDSGKIVVSDKSVIVDLEAAIALTEEPSLASSSTTTPTASPTASPTAGADAVAAAK